ncbi:DgyrCDS2247 [Dimorphilus gyrociliatus]|nr:DgyrCDS2247 [Dimorphilus gyrociliatus]
MIESSGTEEKLETTAEVKPKKPDQPPNNLLIVITVGAGIAVAILLFSIVCGLLRGQCLKRKKRTSRGIYRSSKKHVNRLSTVTARSSFEAGHRNLPNFRSMHRSLLQIYDSVDAAEVTIELPIHINEQQEKFVRYPILDAKNNTITEITIPLGNENSIYKGVTEL